MRRFLIWRREDPSGVSGTGVVAEGVQFFDGVAALRWINGGSTAVYPDMPTLEKIHGHGGASRLLWVDASDHGPRPCTVHGGDTPPEGRPGISYPHTRLVDGWLEPSGAVDYAGRHLFVGQSARLRTGRGELSDLGEIISVGAGVYAGKSRLMVGMLGTDCGPADYPIEEIEALETREECRERNHGTKPSYGWSPALMVNAPEASS